MLRAASKALLRAQATTITCNVTRYASIPCYYHGNIRPCSSSSPFLANGLGSQQAGRRSIEQHSIRSSSHGVRFYQTAADGKKNDALDQNVVSMKGPRETGVAPPEEEMDEASQLHVGAVVVVAEDHSDGASVQAAVSEDDTKLDTVPVKHGASKKGVNYGGLIAQGITKVEGEGVLGVHGPVEAKRVEADEKNEGDGFPAARASGKSLDVTIDPILKQPRAAPILKKLGLYKFVQTPLPRVNKELCDQFLTSYLHRLHSSCGTVRDKTVTITPEAISRVTGLPLGVKPLESRKTQGKYVCSLGDRVYKNCYDLKTVRLIENDEDNQVLVALADLLTKRMGLYPGKAAGPVLWGVHESWHGKTEVKWAAYMAELVTKKSERLVTVEKRSKYGSWLTAVIEDSLRADGSDDKQYKDQDKLKIRLEQMEQKRRMLAAKEKEIKKRQQKVQKLYARCYWFAKSMII